MRFRKIRGPGRLDELLFDPLSKLGDLEESFLTFAEIYSCFFRTVRIVEEERRRIKFLNFAFLQ